MLCLGIESTCDETAAALVTADRRILSSVVFAQAELHAGFGGVVPEIAARAHAEKLDICVSRALAQAGSTLSDVDLISVASGPGLIGGVLSGVMCAKGIAAATGIRLIGVNHLAGHALTPRLTDGIDFPYLMLLASGGHCQFLEVRGPDEFRRIGGTIDDAPGEAFDKTAKLLGLGYPGGPEVESAAQSGDADRFAFPRPLLDRPGCDMSFSGLKTALRRARDQLVDTQGGLTRRDRADLCAGFQEAVADVLAEKTRRAIAAAGAAGAAVAVAGGVAANATIRERVTSAAAGMGAQVIFPPLGLCTDNAAMIAWAGLEQVGEQHQDQATLTARPRWPLDREAVALVGSGKKGAKA